jgi:2'-5' RNA ligase
MSWFIGVPMSFGADEVALPPGRDLRATRPADRHLTLAFLGGVQEGVALAVWRNVPTLELPTSVRAIAWERFGKSAIALEVSDDDQRLEGAAGACHDAAQGLAEVRRPSPFRAHVTMARVPRRGRAPAVSALRTWPLPEGALPLGALTLFRSSGVPAGDRYVVVDRRPAST